MTGAGVGLAHSRLVVFATVLLALAGLWAYGDLGKLEDPDFTVHTALVKAEYPGARAARVEAEVTEVLERHIQQLAELDEIESVSRDGRTVIYVHVQERYTGERLRQVWDELRKKVERARPGLPERVRGPFVEDDYGDVFGLLYAVTGEGFTQRELDDYADELRREVLRVPGVARAELFGRRGERVFLETSRSRIAALGLHPGQIVDAVQRQNVVTPGGAVDLGDERLGLFVTGVFEDVEDVRNVSVYNPRTDERFYLRDIADVYHGYADPPERLLRYNGARALALGVVPDAGADVVALGERLERRLAELEADRPVGIELHTVNDQAAEVLSSVNAFTLNLATAVAIVLAVLLVALGWRTGIIVGSAVPLTILGTFFAMWVAGIDLHRVSLGALIVVLGMLVDNAIVVTELMMTRIQRGVERARAAREAVSETGWPLLVGTAIAALAFSPVALTPTALGEFTNSLFWVVAIALVISWLLAMTFLPLIACYYLPDAPGHGRGDPEDTRLHRGYRLALGGMLRHRGVTLAATLAMVVVAAVAFMWVPRIFFPDSERDQLLVDHWRAEGTRIEAVATDVRRIEDHLLERQDVAAVTSFIGEGAPRFYLPMRPELSNPAYAQLLVELEGGADLETVVAEVDAWLEAGFPAARPRVRPLPLGTPVRYPVELRVSGLREHGELRRLGERVRDWLDADEQTVRARHDWRQRSVSINVDVDQERARAAGLSSAEVAETLDLAYGKGAVGVLIDGDRHLPIRWRLPEAQRGDLSHIDTLEVWPLDGGEAVPLRQIARLTPAWEETVIWRRDRVPTVTVQADLVPGATGEGVVERLDGRLEELALGPGVELEWGGEHEASWDARADVFTPVPVVLAAMALLLVGQFNSVRAATVVALTVPLGLVGVVVALLALRQPFGFIAMLGAMSLAGLLIRNAVVLVERIRQSRTEGLGPYEALVEASVSRLRPVLLTAVTTVFGMIPLAVSGPFWAPMAIGVIGGLAFGTVLILGVVPVLYALAFGVRSPGPAVGGGSGASA